MENEKSLPLCIHNKICYVRWQKEAPAPKEPTSCHRYFVAVAVVLKSVSHALTHPRVTTATAASYQLSSPDFFSLPLGSLKNYVSKFPRYPFVSPVFRDRITDERDCRKKQKFSTEFSTGLFYSFCFFGDGKVITYVPIKTGVFYRGSRCLSPNATLKNTRKAGRKKKVFTESFSKGDFAKKILDFVPVLW